MSDISAVILTLGEKTTERAIDSLNRQTIQPENIVIVRNITPFHKALNYGASQIKANFFIQVDSDMILDPDCLETLRKAMGDKIGMVIGHLRDPLVGRVSSIRMFRTECFKDNSFKDTISPDTDFAEDISKEGWIVIYALRFAGKDSKLWHTFGDHMPDYTASYTYSKYLLEGRRYLYRNSQGGIRSHFKQLENSNHKMSLIAQVALAHGIFIKENKDQLTPYANNKNIERLEHFFSGANEGSNRKKMNSFSNVFIFNPKNGFARYFKLGHDLTKNGRFVDFQRVLDFLSNSKDIFALIEKIALCHGLCSENCNKHVIEDDYLILKKLFPEFSFWHILRKKKDLIANAILHP